MQPTQDMLWRSLDSPMSICGRFLAEIMIIELLVYRNIKFGSNL